MALECLRRTVQGHQRLQILRNCSKNDVTDRKAKEKNKQSLWTILLILVMQQQKS